jgi:cytochrome c oxidase assembly factor CtaG
VEAVQVLPPLTTARWPTEWSVDLPALVVAVLATALYALAVRRVRAGGGRWSRGATCWFVVGGVGSLLVVTCSFLGTYSRTLFWPLAVQDVLLLTLVPVGLTLGRPVALWRAARPSWSSPSGRRVPQLLTFPLTGSVLAVTLLLLVYTTGWDQARLEHPALLELTRLLLLAAGCGFVWPLLGVDEGTGRTSYPVRAMIAFLDGLLDAVPGLAVLGTGHVIAAGYYAHVGLAAPTPAAAQRTGGTAMIALSELVGLPALLLLLVAWVRSDRQQASDVDAALDAVGSGAVLERPWWEVDAGPLADRADRYHWAEDPEGRPPS